MNQEISDSIVNKIRKLLSLSKSSNQAEAESALSKAREFAIRHGINLAMVKVEEGAAEKYVEGKVRMGQRFSIAQRYIDDVISSNFGVRVLYQGNRAFGRHILFLGKESDVEISQMVNDYLNKVFLSVWQNKKKEFNFKLTERDSFFYGMGKGLSAKLEYEAVIAKVARLNEIKEEKGEAEAEEVENKYALVLKSDFEKTQDFVAQKYPKLGRATYRSARIYQGDSLEEGKRAGAKIQIRAGIKDKNTMALQ